MSQSLGSIITIPMCEMLLLLLVRVRKFVVISSDKECLLVIVPAKAISNWECMQFVVTCCCVECLCYKLQCGMFVVTSSSVECLQGRPPVWNVCSCKLQCGMVVVPVIPVPQGMFVRPGINHQCGDNSQFARLGAIWQTAILSPAPSLACRLAAAEVPARGLSWQSCNWLLGSLSRHEKIQLF